MPDYRISGVKLGPFKGKKLGRVLKRWHTLMEVLAQEWAPEKYGEKRDVPWWYGEPTNVGFVAAAVWLSGGNALEEYPTLKKFKTKQKVRDGRGDLRIYVEDDTFVAEAKHCFDWYAFPLDGDTHKLKKDMSKFLHTAWDDACRTQVSRKEKRLGIVFLVPHLLWKNGARHKAKPTDKMIRRWIGVVRNNVNTKNTAILWTFPSVARDLPWKEKGGERNFWPGVVLLVKGSK
jgi:hypothetical protein